VAFPTIGSVAISGFYMIDVINDSWAPVDCDAKSAKTNRLPTFAAIVHVSFL